MPKLPSFLILAAACAAACAQPAPVVETIDGRQVESLAMRRPAAPFTVVFESGARATLDAWGRVPQALARDATVFAYNRPGYGASAPAATPRDGRTVVEELRRLLRAKGLFPPYVLVGHSLGGLYMQLFARAYPDEVRGLVLVDALYPRQVRRSADFPWTTRLAGRLLLSRTVWREIDAIDATGDAVLALPAIDRMPVVRLVNRPTARPGELPPVAVDFGAFRTDRESADLVRALYPNARKVTVDSSHQMALSSPDAVIDAIRDVLAAAAMARDATQRQVD